jgi:hypothetical protein
MGQEQQKQTIIKNKKHCFKINRKLGYFSKENVEIDNKYMKKCSILPISKEM